MHKIYSLPEKYDKSYKKNDTAFGVGILAVLVWLMINIPTPKTSLEWNTYTLPFRAIVAIWVWSLSSKLNRYPAWDTLCAFFFPAITLIVISRLPKRNVSYKMDMHYTLETQAKELRKEAQKYIDKKRWPDALATYTILVQNLPYTEVDKETIVWLNENIANSNATTAQ